jgi:hypothetical protein
LGIIIPQGLAKELNEYLDKDSVKGCKDINHFRQKLQRRSNLDALVCPAEMVSANDAIMGWMVSIRPPKISAVFKQDDARRAMNTAVAFIRDTAMLLTLTSEQAEMAAIMLYYLVYVKMFYNEAIKSVNIIRGEDIDASEQAQTTTATCSSKTTATNCDVACDMAGAIIGCTTTCSEASACSKITGKITTTKVIAYTPPAITVSTTLAPAAAPTPKCNVDDISKFPANLFNQAVYSKFCKDLKDLKTGQKWTVDSAGSQVNKKRRDSEIRPQERSPPVSPKNYPNYRTTLEFAPGKHSGQCDLNCAQAYRLIADSNCGRTAAEQNIMASEASVDAGCGTFSYKINYETDGKLGNRVCHERNQFGDHGDVHGGEISTAATGCASIHDKDATLKAGDPPKKMNSQYGRTHYQFIMSWIDHCQGPAQDIRYPFPGEPQILGNTCWQLLLDDWKKCELLNTFNLYDYDILT